jgi:hypothetical protein
MTSRTWQHVRCPTSYHHPTWTFYPAPKLSPDLSFYVFDWLQWLGSSSSGFFFSYYNWIYNLTSLFYSNWQNVWLTRPDNVCSFPSRKREKREKTKKKRIFIFLTKNRIVQRLAGCQVFGKIIAWWASSTYLESSISIQATGPWQ